MRILFVGDIVGKPGRKVFINTFLPEFLASDHADLIIVNGENSAAGFGITAPVAEELLSAGVHVITSGNHIWDKKEALELIAREPRLIRPLNYPPGVPGNGSYIVTTDAGVRVAVINAAGRVFMQPLDCPFRALEQELLRLESEADVVFVDFHAEATSEKIAFGYYFDGRVSAVVGTHTHVQTADERILPGGTAYITDVGMTGPCEGVIGMGSTTIMEKFLTQMPRKYDVAAGQKSVCAVLIDVDEVTRRAVGITRLQRFYD